ncbi:MAG: tripartite-type tricarboxylate transporter receptor subunit TctC [Verrucomicrobiales bacterium]|jgi:tripartite-type tricarboxylate transporter receptor subunit TctC
MATIKTNTTKAPSRMRFKFMLNHRLRKRDRARGFVALTGVLALLCSGCGDDPEADFPRKPIEVIVPFNEGGASTMTARPIQLAIQNHPEISPQPFAILPTPGAGGAVGSLRVKNARPDGYTILNLHDAILTRKYVEGGPSYGPEAFVPIAATCESGSVLCVGPSSRFESLQQLLDEAASEPGSVKIGVNHGMPSHFVALLLSRERENLRFSYPLMGGGADRFSHLSEGRIDATLFSASEYFLFKRGGVEALVYLADERHPSMPDTPTAKEEGVDIVWGLTQMWWAPKGTPPARVAKLASILKAAVESETVKEVYAELKVEPRFVEGEKLQQLLDAREAVIRELNVHSTPVSSPPTTMLVVGGVVIFGLLVVFAGFRKASQIPRIKYPPGPTIAVLLGLIAFIAIFAFRLVPFWIPAALFSGILGFRIAPDKNTKIAAVCLGIGLSVGLHLLFTQVIILDLP